MNFIESKDSLQNFLQKKIKIDLLFPIWSSSKAHPLVSDISFVYYKSEYEDGIINFNHIDGDTIEKFDIAKLCNENTLVFGNRYVNSIGLDYEWVYFEEYGKPFILNEFAEEVYRGYRIDYNNINDCIPIMKWYEILQKIPSISNRRDWYRIYSESIKTLGRLEGAGVKVVEEKFIDSFKFNPAFIYNGHVLTQYNPYTTTGRPSNRHLNVNYSALNKSDGSREAIVSRFEGGSLIQMDYESYHIRLIAKMIGYEFPQGITAHQHLANLYGVGVDEGKGITFRYLYGGLDDFARSIPFFQKVDVYINEVYQKFVLSGRLQTPIFKREIHFTKIEGATEQKVFNYLLQALETEINYRKIEMVLDFLNEYKSKMILYTYDAFLIDTHPSERDIIIKGVSDIMERGGFPVKSYEGRNYGSLELLS
jgi:hypothetical protein